MTEDGGDHQRFWSRSTPLRALTQEERDAALADELDATLLLDRKEVYDDDRDSPSDWALDLEDRLRKIAGITVKGARWLPSNPDPDDDEYCDEWEAREAVAIFVPWKKCLLYIIEE